MRENMREKKRAKPIATTCKKAKNQKTTPKPHRFVGTDFIRVEYLIL